MAAYLDPIVGRYVHVTLAVAPIASILRKRGRASRSYVFTRPVPTTGSFVT